MASGGMGGLGVVSAGAVDESLSRIRSRQISGLLQWRHRDQNGSSGQHTQDNDFSERRPS